MIDYTKIADVAGELVEELPEESNGEIVAVGIVVVVDEVHETYTRIRCSTGRRFEKVGLFREALSIVEGQRIVDE